MHSIGHGIVTYAAPLGWGADQGVVIVRHVFADGSTILSFYGHLDPPSVVLKVGECVARGDQVGRIGRPRSPPHLHFEIRVHRPNSPGPGYWSVDPTLAGWRPPSQFIWINRIASLPGVQWTRPFSARDTISLGQLGGDTYVAIEGDQLIGINLLDGGLRWSLPRPNWASGGMIAADRPLIYVSSLFGQVKAFDMSDLQGADASESSSEERWEIKLDAGGFSTLMPLPSGGVVVSFREKMFGVSPQGELLWQHDAITRGFDWELTDGQLIVSTPGAEGAIWRIDESGPIELTEQTNGRPAIAGDRIWVYDEDGIYRLNSETPDAELMYALPIGFLRLGDVVGLPDGGVLVAHTDVLDRRLIALNADGSLRWQRSYSDILRGRQHLLMLKEHAFLVTQYDTNSISEVSIFAIDLSSAELTRIFIGGSRNPVGEETRVSVLDDDRVLINIGGDVLALLDTRIAIEAVSQGTGSR